MPALRPPRKCAVSLPLARGGMNYFFLMRNVSSFLSL
jgi:hypothetical protein